MINLGSSKYNRVLPALAPEHVLLDVRTLPDLLSHVKKIAQSIVYYKKGSGKDSWEVFFEKNNLFLLIEIMEFDVENTFQKVNNYLQQFYPGEGFQKTGKLKPHTITLNIRSIRYITSS